MSIETWRERYAHLLEEMSLNHHYRDEASQRDYKTLAQDLDKDELGGRNGAKAFFSRMQVRRNGASRIKSRNIPMWFFNNDAVTSFLIAQFPKLREPGRERQHAALWFYIIRRWRIGQSAFDIARDWAPSRPTRKRSTRPIKPDVTNEDQEYWDKVLRSHSQADNRRVITDSEGSVDLVGGELDPVTGRHTGRFVVVPFESSGQPITEAKVHRIIQAIKFVANGLRTDGKPRKSVYESSALDSTS